MMKNTSPIQSRLSPFMQYLAALPQNNQVRLPPLAELSQDLGLSVASLREQLEVARMMGLVEVHPRTGIQKMPFTFTKAVSTSLFYGMLTNDDTFAKYADFRKQIELVFWKQAVSLLTEDDHNKLVRLVKRAFEKLHHQPPQIPHEEHKELHLSIFRRLDNPFVQGVLEAYWQAYEESGLAMYTDLQYLEQVWRYHQKMVDAICSGDVDNGYRIVTEHMDLISQRAKPIYRHRFE